MYRHLICLMLIVSPALSYMMRGVKDALKETNIESIRKGVKSVDSAYHHSAYERLAYYVDTMGPRMWGSKSMALAVDALYDDISKMGFDKVYKENLGTIKTWRRGKESLTLLDPRPFPQKLNLIGLGKGAPGDVTAEVIVVRSFDELDAVKDQVKDKIVCYNQPWINYGTSVQYRGQGPKRAAKYGAKGVILRSVTPYSIDSPHTGGTSYDAGFEIPAAAISVEDAEMLQRMQDRGQTIKVHLYIESEWYDSTSDNIIAEIRGSKYPDQILLMGGHWDSWDTGSQTGANDDGGGVMVCLEALRILQATGIRPKRTIRFIAWSGEEMGLKGNGAEYYANKHINEFHVLAFESDSGTTKPYGFGVTAGVRATQIMAMLAQQYLTGVDAEKIKPGDGVMVDTGYLAVQGIPTMRNLIADNATEDFYFTYHHSAGDSMTMMDADDLDDNVVAIASMMYLVADLDETLPR